MTDNAQFNEFKLAMCFNLQPELRVMSYKSNALHNIITFVVTK